MHASNDTQRVNVSPSVLADRMLKEMQEQEFLEAKRIDEEKKQAEAESERKRIEAENAEKLKADQLEQKKQEILSKKRSLISAEPPASEDSTSEIAFRFPSGKRVIRRFLKRDSIQRLYDYVDVCLAEEDLVDRKYIISQTMPKKAYNDMNASLESERLYPKALVQIELTDEQ